MPKPTSALSPNFSHKRTVRKPSARSRGGIVVTQNRIASEAGARVLKAGGHAVDAAVAAAMTVGVAEPWMSGIGGVGAMLVYEAKTGKIRAFDGGGRSPRSLKPEDYELAGGIEAGNLFGWSMVKGNINTVGPKAVIAPTQPALLALAHKHYGKKRWRDLLKPAIALAEEGLPVDWHTAVVVGAASCDAGDEGPAPVLSVRAAHTSGPGTDDDLIWQISLDVTAVDDPPGELAPAPAPPPSPRGLGALTLSSVGSTDPADGATVVVALEDELPPTIIAEAFAMPGDLDRGLRATISGVGSRTFNPHFARDVPPEGGAGASDALDGYGKDSITVITERATEVILGLASRDELAGSYPDAESSRSSVAIVEAAARVAELNWRSVRAGRGAPVTARFDARGYEIVGAAGVER